MNTVPDIVEIARTIEGAELARLVEQATAQQGVYTFGELLQLHNVQQVSQAMKKMSAPMHVFSGTVGLQLFNILSRGMGAHCKRAQVEFVFHLCRSCKTATMFPLTDCWNCLLSECGKTTQVCRLAFQQTGCVLRNASEKITQVFPLAANKAQYPELNEEQQRKLRQLSIITSLTGQRVCVHCTSWFLEAWEKGRLPIHQ